MCAAYGNIVNSKRSRLEELIPLRSPFSLFIEPSDVCNFKCNFCAAQSGKSDVHFRKQIMNFDLFKKAIDSVKDFSDHIKILRLGFQGEPLLNPCFTDMVRYARDSNSFGYIETITNGSMLNPELNQRIADSGINRVRISVEGITSADYMRIAGVNMDIDRFLDNIRDLHDRSGDCEIYCKIVDIALPQDDGRERFSEMFRNICDRYFVDNVIPTWSDFEEIKKVKDFSLASDSAGGVHGQKLQNVVICPIPFYTMVVHADGSVGVCCSDWKRKLTIGDLNTESLSDIWKSEKLRRFWIMQAEGKREGCEVCRMCLNPMYDCADNIDPYGNTLVERLKV